MATQAKKDRDMMVIMLGALFHAAGLVNPDNDREPSDSLHEAQKFVEEVERQKLTMPGGE